jgi:hypothetical protein
MRSISKKTLSGGPMIGESGTPKLHLFPTSPRRIPSGVAKSFKDVFPTT